MNVQFNHTIIHARDKHESANFMAQILGLSEPQPFFHFLVVKAANNVSLDFMSTSEEIQVQHYAFLVGEDEFDQIFERIKTRNLKYWADPAGRSEGKINQNDGGSGLYFKDPCGHVLEIITRPYGSG